MTFAEIVSAVQSQLNLTSAESATRIGTRVNDRYKRVTSSIGLNLTRRGTVQTNASIGVSTLVFTGIEKLINVIDKSTTPHRVLREVTVEELRAGEPFANSFAQRYAVLATGASTITILMDCVPQAGFTLYADGYPNATTLSGAQVPAFAESFHDLLYHGALADEYRKIQQRGFAQDAEGTYERRLAELRMFQAKSSYLDLMQGGQRGRLAGAGVPGAGGSGSSPNGAANYTQTGLITFDRTTAAPGSRYPFAVAAGSEKVANLDADLLDGNDSTFYLSATNLNAGTVPLARLSGITNAQIAAGTIRNAEISATAAILWSKMSTAFSGVCQGRLTLTAGTPVTTADVTGATSIKFTPYLGNLIALYDGAGTWNVRAFVETSLALGTLVSGRPYDVFAFDNAGTMNLELLAWTSTTARATALVLQDGVWVKTGATTRRYLGTFHTTATTTTEDSAVKRYVWNYYNRVQKPMLRSEAAASWAYSSATVRQANANAANQLALVHGVAESRVDVSVYGLATQATGASAVNVGIGEDVTNAVVAGCLNPAAPASVGLAAAPVATLRKVPAIGAHFYSWLEFTAAVLTTTWYGTGFTGASGISALWEC